VSAVIDLAKSKFGDDWHKAIICAWPEWEYIEGMDSLGKPFRFCRTWYAGLTDEEFEEMLAEIRQEKWAVRPDCPNPATYGNWVVGAWNHGYF
jgi:hypothetical protein